MDYWIEEYKREQPESELVIVGNKTDSSERVVTEDMADVFARGRNMKSMTCSALNGNGVREAFEQLTTQILNNSALMNSLPESTDEVVGIRGQDESKGCC